MKKFLLIFTFVVISAILLLQIDDDLTPDSQAMLNSDTHNTWQKPSEAFTYLTAIGVSADKDPTLEGRKIIAELRKWEVNSNQLHQEALEIGDTEFVFDKTFSFPNELELSKNNDCPLFSESNALITIIREDKQFNLDEYSELLEQRYKKFISLADFHTMISPQLLMPYFSNWHYISQGNKIALYNIIQHAKNDPQSAIDQLDKLIKKQQIFVGKADDLISRAVAYANISESIDVLSLLLRRYDIKTLRIEPLNSHQLDFSSITQRELAFFSSAVKSSIKGRVYETSESKIMLPKWLYRIIIKPNMSINSAVATYMQAIVMSKANQADFKSLQASPTETPLFSIRNFVGNILSNITISNYQDFITYGFNINTKIALLNATSGKTITPSLVETLNNPYYASNDHISLNVEEKLICFDSPIKCQEKFRCLPY